MVITLSYIEGKCSFPDVKSSCQRRLGWCLYLVWSDIKLERGARERERAIDEVPRQDRRQGESEDDRLFQRGQSAAERIKTATETRTAFRRVPNKASGQRLLKERRWLFLEQDLSHAASPESPLGFLKYMRCQVMPDPTDATEEQGTVVSAKW